MPSLPERNPLLPENELMRLRRSDMAYEFVLQLPDERVLRLPVVSLA